MPSVASSSFISSSSLSSRYTFKNPSNFSTSPCAVRSSLLVEILIFAMVFSSSASAIWLAIVRFHTSSYSLRQSASSTASVSIAVGRIASCASCADSFLFLNFRTCTYCLPYCDLILAEISFTAVSLRLTLSVRI